MPLKEKNAVLLARSTAVLKCLANRYTAKAMVDFGTPEDTLIATLMSARTRDEQVIAAYPKLRACFPSLADLAKADVADIAEQIHSVGFYKAKARAIKGLATILLEKHGGKVPRTMEELIELPGVGRKTASCVLWYAFGIPAIAVDTHVFRLAKRLGWVRGVDVVVVEQELARVVPQKLWGEMNRLFVQFGRTVCLPRSPRCWECPVRDLCLYSHKTPAPVVRSPRS